MSRSTMNGPLGQSSSLEDLRDVLDEIPSLNESTNPVHSGSPSYSPRGDMNAGENQQRSSMPPNTFPTDIQWQASVPPANTTVPLSSPSPSLNGEDGRLHLSKGSNVSKIDFIKQWSISTYKCTRQILSEKLGKGTRTTDPELETQIDQLRETQKRLSNILRLARALSSHFYHVVQTQTQLAESFSDLASKSPDLQEEFTYNAETQKNLSKNGETLLGALNFFVSSLNTLCNKTMEDTLLTIKQFEIARLEFDAYRTDLEEMMQGNRGDNMSSRLDEARKNFALQKDKYERLRSDVSVKMKFLEENKVKVMHKQLLLFHNAISAYFSGNQVMLEATLKQFNIKLKNPNSSGPSWLEQ